MQESVFDRPLAVVPLGWQRDSGMERTIARGEGFADVIALNAPDIAAPGDIVEISTTVKNTGSFKDRILIDINAELTPDYPTIIETVEIDLAVGSSHTLTTTTTMPDFDLNVFGVGHHLVPD